MSGAHKKSLAVLGATGSIGHSVLDLVARYDDRYEVVLLAGHQQVAELAELALKFRPRHVVLTGDVGFTDLEARLGDSGAHLHHGMDALLTCLDETPDLTINGISGIAGLLPSLRVLESGGALGLANKESLVAAGALLVAASAQHGGVILPTDSEHNAIFQVWSAQHAAAIKSITLTASGGPFLNTPLTDFAHLTAEAALRHPKWQMGRKISIDSATMMNKGLEVIEACVLFDLPVEAVDVVVHPQAVVHGLVHYADGSVLAQLGAADMRVPLSYVLAWPERLPWCADGLDVLALSRLDFLPVDVARFPAVELARGAWRQGGCAPCVLNAANEVAVEAFLKGKIGFLDIIASIEHTLSAMSWGGNVDLEAVLGAHDEATATAQAWIEQKGA